MLCRWVRATTLAGKVSGSAVTTTTATTTTTSSAFYSSSSTSFLHRGFTASPLALVAGGAAVAVAAATTAVYLSDNLASGGVEAQEKPFGRWTIVEAAEAASPAVVNIANVQELGAVDRIFRGGAVWSSHGSGFIIDESGKIITNAHVILDKGSNHASTSIEVTLSDGSVYDGTVECLDRESDVAVVRIHAKVPLPTIKIGSAKYLRPGEWVVAVGSPLTLQNTVTAGIVSAVHRSGTSLGMSDARLDYIQCDAAINQGNSGGPLINLDGQVIGMSCMRAKDGEGISFAIPIDTVMDIVSQLEKWGSVRRPFVGIQMIELNERVSRQLRAAQPSFPLVASGVLVPRVVPNSPAAHAGILSGDIIQRVGSLEVSSPKQIIDVLSENIGTTFSIHILRLVNGTPVMLKVKLTAQLKPVV